MLAWEESPLLEGNLLDTGGIFITREEFLCSGGISFAREKSPLCLKERFYGGISLTWRNLVNLEGILFTREESCILGGNLFYIRESSLPKRNL